MQHRSAAHRAPKSVWFPVVIGGTAIALVFAVALSVLPWWLALLLWAAVAAGSLAVERLRFAHDMFDRITTFGTVDAEPSESSEPTAVDKLRASRWR